MCTYFDISIFGISFHINMSAKVNFIAYWKNWWKEIKNFSVDDDKKEKVNEQKTEKV